jgi:hypothetical protein
MSGCYPLPGRKVRLGNQLFFIHGIVHETPLISISEGFKRELVEKFRGYSIICEDGISSWIPGAKSFNEAEQFKINKLTLTSYLRFLKSYFYNKHIIKSHKTPLAKQVERLKRVEDLEPIRAELFASYHPEPYGMNALVESSCGGTLENPMGELPLRIRRYIYEAEESISYARRNNLEELHIIVGCAHELPLEYLISTKRKI